MIKKTLMLLVVTVLLVSGLVGCMTYGDTTGERRSRHMELHLLVPYKQLVELHREIDYFIFNLDEGNPNLY